MAALSETLGSTPRTKLIEALLRLGDTEVSRGELALEAGLYRMSTNRAIPALLQDEIITRVRGGSRPTYRANLSSPKLQLIAQMSTALDLLDSVGPAALEYIESAVREFRPLLQLPSQFYDVRPQEVIRLPEIRLHPVLHSEIRTGVSLDQTGGPLTWTSTVIGGVENNVPALLSDEPRAAEDLQLTSVVGATTTFQERSIQLGASQ